jgi:hypothetical protein
MPEKLPAPPFGTALHAGPKSTAVVTAGGASFAVLAALATGAPRARLDMSPSTATPAVARYVERCFILQLLVSGFGSVMRSLS